MEGIHECCRRLACTWLLGLCFIFAPAAAYDAAAAGCVSAASDLISWWPGDGNANDIASTNNGMLRGGATANAAGEVDSCFSFDGTNSFVQVPDAPAT